MKKSCNFCGKVFFQQCWVIVFVEPKYVVIFRGLVVLKTWVIVASNVLVLMSSIGKVDLEEGETVSWFRLPQIIMKTLLSLICKARPFHILYNY